MSRYRFDVFSFDSDDGRLEHAELQHSTTLRPQVASLLVRLLESPRIVVDREALCLAVWGDKAVVDFESGLAAVVRELRQAFVGLGGSAELLETMPRRGYRLRADVTPVTGPSENYPPEAPPPPRRRTARRAAIVLAAGAALAVTAGLAWWQQHSPDPARLALAVLPFERYGVATADGTRLELLLADSLLAELWQAKLEGIVLIGRATLYPYQGREDVAGAVAQDLGAQLLIEGSIERHEGGWRVTARLLEMPDGQILWLDGVESAREVLPTPEIAAQLAGSLARAWTTQPGRRTVPRRTEQGVPD